MTGGGLASALATVAAAVETELETLLAPRPEVPDRLVEAMRYGALGAGKRLRPFLVWAVGTIGDADPAACRRVGAAVELLHAYSLIHDDLPAMDDAQLRRGRPSCHIAFDEATAILAGDALQALAFDTLARDDWPADAPTRLALLAGLGRAAGMTGMCGGQMLDLQGEGTLLDEAAIVRMQRLKTGALIGFACEAGARLAGLRGTALAAVQDYARALGLAFQIKDDLLDVTRSSAETGKDAGADAAHGKATFVALAGVAGAERRLLALAGEAQVALDKLGHRASLLRELFEYVVQRRS